MLLLCFASVPLFAAVALTQLNSFQLAIMADKLETFDFDPRPLDQLPPLPTERHDWQSDDEQEEEGDSCPLHDQPKSQRPSALARLPLFVPLVPASEDPEADPSVIDAIEAEEEVERKETEVSHAAATATAGSACHCSFLTHLLLFRSSSPLCNLKHWNSLTV